MAIESRLRELDARHRDLDARIRAEAARPSIDSTELTELKRLKLRLKEEMEGLRRQGVRPH
jgi:hypothetical protein